MWMRRSTSQIRTVRTKKFVFDKGTKAKRGRPLLWQLQEISYHIMQVELGFGENHQFEQLWPIVPLPVISNDSFDTFMFFRHHQANWFWAPIHQSWNESFPSLTLCMNIQLLFFMYQFNYRPKNLRKLSSIYSARCHDLQNKLGAETLEFCSVSFWILVKITMAAW